MSSCDYLSILESFDLESVEELHRLMARTVKGCTDIQKAFEGVADPNR
jgi:hypothetical protein